MYIPHERKRLIAYIFVLIMSFSMSKSHLIIDIIANLKHQIDDQSIQRTHWPLICV